MTLLKAADESIENFNLHMLNAHPGIPDREGIDYESAFVGPAMRRHPRLHYIPSRLSMVPILFRDHYRPDIVFLHTSPRRYDTVSLGVEVNILPAARRLHLPAPHCNKRPPGSVTKPLPSCIPASRAHRSGRPSTLPATASPPPKPCAAKMPFILKKPCRLRYAPNSPTTRIPATTAATCAPRRTARSPPLTTSRSSSCRT